MANNIKNVVLGSGSSLFWASSRRFWSRSCFSSQVLSRQKITGSDFSSPFRKFPVGTSIVSRRSSRSYSHQSFYQVSFDILLHIYSTNLIQATPRGTFGYSTQQYSKSDHFYTARSSICGSIWYSYVGLFHHLYVLQALEVLPAQCLPLPLHSLEI